MSEKRVGAGWRDHRIEVLQQVAVGSLLLVCMVFAIALFGVLQDMRSFSDYNSLASMDHSEFASKLVQEGVAIPQGDGHFVYGPAYVSCYGHKDKLRCRITGKAP